MGVPTLILEICPCAYPLPYMSACHRVMNDANGEYNDFKTNYREIKKPIQYVHHITEGGDRIIRLTYDIKSRALLAIISTAKKEG